MLKPEVGDVSLPQIERLKFRQTFEVLQSGIGHAGSRQIQLPQFAQPFQACQAVVGLLLWMKSAESDGPNSGRRNQK